MKELRAWWQRLCGQPSIEQVESCDIDACDHGPWHQMIHVNLVNYLPTLLRRLYRADFKVYDHFDRLYKVGIFLPHKFLSLVRNDEAQEIIYEYLLKYYSMQVKDCKITRAYGDRLRLTVYFRTDDDD